MQQGFYLNRNFDSRWKLLEAAKDRIAVAETLDSLTEVVRSTARAVCSADGATFVLREGDKCHYVEEDAIAPLWKGRRFAMNACISGWCMLNARTAAIADIFADPRIPHDAYRPTFVKSLIMTPVGEKNVAAMGAYWKEKRSFSDMEVLTVKTFSAIVGRALSDLL